MSLEIRSNKQILSACGHTDSMKKDEYISSPGKKKKQNQKTHLWPMCFSQKAGVLREGLFDVVKDIGVP